jgi:hypothetical protein
VLAAQGKIPPKLFIFANVGDDSEHPDTLAYVRDVAMPYAAAHGVELLELRRSRRGGAAFPSLYAYMEAHPASVPIPIRMNNAKASKGRRTCTQDWKIQPIADYLKTLGATADNPATVHLGISIDEAHRMNNKEPIPWTRKAYPLVTLGLNRSACAAIIEAAGLPIPPKSACWFCPLHNMAVWQEKRHTEPELFERAADLEALIIARRRARKQSPVWLSGGKRPLREATSEYVTGDMFAEESACESGYCMI